jgi:mannose-P-dolichol utilization defect protein 1
MTTITRNLPWFIKDTGVSIIGQKCYVSLVENLNIGDVECLKYSLSKGLGIGIVIGGSIMKVPQVMLILNAKSARGLSLPAYILETLSYAITLAYSYRNGFPFSTYGENFFLTLQNTLITLLIINYSHAHSRDNSTKLTVACMSTAAAAFSLYILPKETIALLQLCTLPLSVFSKFPQIRQNARSQSTGQLSAFAVISQIAGCLARLFTTATEVGDSLVTAGFALALILNIVLGAQLWMYWGKDTASEDIPMEEYEDNKVHAPVPKFAATTTATDLNPGNLSTPEKAPWHQTANLSRPEGVSPPRSPARSPAPGRKWARKVD